MLSKGAGNLKYKILKNLDNVKASEIDQVSAEFLKDGAPVIAIHLVNIINRYNIINEIPSALSDIYLYADDFSIFYQHKDVAEIENFLNKELGNMFDWLVDNKLSIHFGILMKIKLIVFFSVRKKPWRSFT